MKKAFEYRDHAKECRALARTALTDGERQQLLQMAETWDALAVQREDFVNTHPELSRRASEAEVEASPSGVDLTDSKR
jgi:hypothetical protein